MKTLLIMALLFLSACSTAGHHVTDSPNAWISVGDSKKEEVYWCEAKAGAKPVCTKPELK